MGLHLHYVDSIVPHLSEILEPIIRKHIDFKLKDSFRILTPNLAASHDIEELLIADERLGNVLIGKSVLSWEQFWKSILSFHPNPNPVINKELQKIVLRKVLQNDPQAHSTSIKHLNQYLFEIKRYRQLESFQNRNIKQTKFIKDYETIINHRLKMWDEFSAQQEAWDLLKSALKLDWEQINDIFFLGFLYPDQQLLMAIKAIIHSYPNINLYLFFQAPETIIDPESLIEPLLKELEKIATEIIHHKKSQQPEQEQYQHATPWHEANFLYNRMASKSQDSCIYFPSGTKTIDYFNLHTQADQSFNDSKPPPLKNPSTVPQKILLSATQQNKTNEEVYFFKVYEILLPLFLEARRSLANIQNILALQHLDQCFAILQRCLRAEQVEAELRTIQDWLADLGEEFSEIITNQKQNPKFKNIIRQLNSPGLKQFDTIYIASLNEENFPKASRFLLFPELSSDPLVQHEARLGLKQLLYSAKDTVILNLYQHNMNGKIQAHSPIIMEQDLAFENANKEETIVRHRQNHPFYHENLQREQARTTNGTFNIDNGNLVNTLKPNLLLNKFKKRPISASYIDDFAKCPWKFFARWHLKGEEIPEEEIELGAMSRGKISHLLLEKLYRDLIDRYFDKNSLPTAENIQEILEEKIKELLIGLQKDPETLNIPQAILIDEVKKIKRRVSNLCLSESENWSQHKKPLLPKYLEWKFGNPPFPSIEYPVTQEQSVPIAGAIDRIDIDETNNSFLVIDYKSSSSDILARAIRGKMSFQIFLYLYAVNKALVPNGTAIGGLYWDLKKTKKNQGMVKKSNYQEYFEKLNRSSSYLSDEKYEQLSSQLENTLSSHLKQILQGHYLLDPKDCQGARCAFHEICRYDQQPQN